MARSSGVILLFLLSSVALNADPGGRSEVATNLCTIPRTQVLRIPVNTLNAGSSDGPAATLMISRGAVDELPEGPSGFDVLEDGSLLITDPLRNQVSSFDSHGRFRTAWKIGFPADSLTVIANDLVLIREANSGEVRAFDREGQPQAMNGSAVPVRPEAQVPPGKNRATVGRAGPGDTRPGPLEIQLDKPDLTLLSVEELATDQKGDAYVALETTARDKNPDAITLNKYVRRYSSDGKLLGEISDIPLDYYVSPVDELRVHRGVVYQLQPTSSEIRVNIWDTNQVCSHQSH